MSDQKPKSRKVWFALAVALQVLILAAVPARHLYARWTGTTVFLKTAPVDPYDVMRGYYVTLTYNISRPPGVSWGWWSPIDLQNMNEPTATTRPAATTTAMSGTPEQELQKAIESSAKTPGGIVESTTTAPAPPTVSPQLDKLRHGEPVYVTVAKGDGEAWRALAYDAEWPAKVPPGAVVIKGKKHYSGVLFGIEAYFIAETMRDEIAEALRDNRDTALVEIKVDSTGHAAIVRLKINNRVYDY